MAVGNTTLGTVPTRSSVGLGGEQRLGRAGEHARRSSASRIIAPGRVVHLLLLGSNAVVDARRSPRGAAAASPPATRIGGGPAPILSSSNGYSAPPRAGAAPSSVRARRSRSTSRDRHVARSRCLAARRSTPAGRCTPSPGADQPGPTSAGAASRSGLPVRPRHRLGEEHRVLVGVQVEVDVQVGVVREVHRAEPPPLAQVLRHRERGLRARAGRTPRRSSRAGRVGDPGDPRVLDAGVVRAALPALVRARARRPRRSTPAARRRRATTSASPTRDTLPARHQRGSR